MKLIRTLFFVTSLFAFGTSALASVPISASSITDSFGTALPSGRLCFTPVNAAAAPTGFRVGATQVVPNETCGSITAGVLQTGLSVPPTSDGIFYHVYVKSAYANTVLRDFGMTSITGSSWTLDTFDEDMAVLPVSAISVGTITTLSPGTPASCTITGTAPSYHLNCGVPQGPATVVGSGGAAGDWDVTGNLNSDISTNGDLQAVQTVGNLASQIAALGTNGGSLHIQPGVYDLASTGLDLSTSTNVYDISGQRRGVIDPVSGLPLAGGVLIKFSGCGPAINVKSNNMMHIHDISLVYTGTASACGSNVPIGIEGTVLNQGELDHLNITGFPIPVEISGSSYTTRLVRIHDSELIGSQYPIYLTGGGTSIDQPYEFNTEIYHNHLNCLEWPTYPSTTAAGVRTDGGGLLNIHNNLIDGCYYDVDVEGTSADTHIYDNDLEGSHTAVHTASGTTRTAVIDNTFDDVTTFTDFNAASTDNSFCATTGDATLICRYPRGQINTVSGGGAAGFLGTAIGADPAVAEYTPTGSGTWAPLWITWTGTDSTPEVDFLYGSAVSQPGSEAASNMVSVPKTNLTASPVIYVAGTLTAKEHFSRGTVALASGSATVTFATGEAFASNVSFSTCGLNKAQGGSDTAVLTYAGVSATQATIYSSNPTDTGNVSYCFVGH